MLIRNWKAVVGAYPFTTLRHLTPYRHALRYGRGGLQSAFHVSHQRKARLLAGEVRAAERSVQDGADFRHLFGAGKL